MDMGDFICIAIVICVTLMFGALALLNTYNYTDNVSNTEPILSLSDSSLIYGSFTLGSGYISQIPVYFYYSGNSVSGYQLQSKSSYTSKIFLDEDNTPYLKTLKKCGNNFFGNSSCYEYAYEFHIPHNGIVQKYNLDSEV